VSDAARGPDASNPRGYLELEAVKDLEKGAAPAWLPAARGKAVKVVSPLLHWLPDTCNYRVILMERDLDEVIASQNRMLAASGAGVDKAQDARVKDGYRALDEGTMRLLRARRCFSTLVVRYVDAVAHPEETARRVDRFLGGGLDVRRMADAVDPALYRNRRPSATVAPPSRS